MQNDIVGKLTKEFSEPISSERQVVYILVELRKLLQLTKTLNNYGTLKLCCDWAVHPKLSWNPTVQKIVKLLDEYEVKYRREAVGVQQAELQGLSDFFQHNTFRREIVEACAANDIPPDAFQSDDWWRTFLVHYTEVVKDCPLEATGDNTRHVEHVTAQAVAPELAAAVMPNKQFGIWWEWSLKGEDRANGVMSFF